MDDVLQEIVTPDVLYEEVIEADQRVALYKDECQLRYKCPVVDGVTGEKVGLLVFHAFKNKQKSMYMYMYDGCPFRILYFEFCTAV